MADPVAPSGTDPKLPGDTPPSPDPKNPAPDDGANQPKGKGSATPGDDETVTLKKSDYNNLIGQRDTANNDLKGQSAFINQLAQERYIGEFLKDNAEDYPDLEPEDLAHVWGEDEDFHKEAKRLQARYERVTQKKLHDIENPPTPPRESPESQANREAELAKKPGRNALAEVFRGRMK